MPVGELSLDDAAAATALWEAVGLTRPWNDPAADFERALTGPTSTVLGVRDGAQLVGTVMVGHDGHRGWVYYLAVAPDRRREGLGARLMAAAEEWLRSAGAVKLLLMVRDENDPVHGFYERLGYADDGVRVRARWLVDPPVPKPGPTTPT
jgi:ribosomal protein S18 acetylase RimI-like enzyme